MNHPCIFVLGYFDGVHLGHQALIRACTQLAGETGADCGAVTFSGHPDALLLGNAPRLLSTPGDRKALLQKYGIRQVLELPFTNELMRTPWQTFLDWLCAEHQAAGLVCGSDFRFGTGGLGTSDCIRAYCDTHHLPCRIVPQVLFDGVRISSTDIRALLEQNRFSQALQLLGHGFQVTGTVLWGKQLGRTIGFPTANLAYPADLVCLPRGVYAATAQAEGHTYQAIVNVGVRPTVSGECLNIEAHLMDFSGTLYGKTLCLTLLCHLRPEKHFPSLSALQTQISRDLLAAEKYFQKTKTYS